MTLFDTDVASDFVQSRSAVVALAMAIPKAEQAIAVVTAEELLRGRLAEIRRYSASATPSRLIEAYRRLGETIEQVKLLRVVPYDSTADALFRSWRAQKIRIGTQDLRIAAIAFAHGATLVTRNRRDYELVPGLSLAVWS